MKKALVLSLVSMLAVGAMAQTQNAKLNEVAIDVPGTDDTQEFIELIGSGSLSGLTLLSLEGDGAAAGTIDQAISLGAFSFGSNGLLLIRDAGSNISWIDEFGALQTAPSAGTNTFTSNFTPDLENGSNTFLIVSGFTGAVGNDLDSNNDGALDASPWTSVLDGIGVTENDGANNFQYATGLGFFGFAAQAFNPDGVFRIRDGVGDNWVAMDVLGTNPGGPYAADLAEIAFQMAYDPEVDLAATFAGGQGFTPGGVNEKLVQAPVPEPATMAVLGVGALALLRRRR